jgi:hypothetical protein
LREAVVVDGAWFSESAINASSHAEHATAEIYCDVILENPLAASRLIW